MLGFSLGSIGSAISSGFSSISSSLSSSFSSLNLGSALEGALSDVGNSIKSSLTNMAVNAVQSGINKAAQTVAGKVGKAIGGSFGATLGNIAGGAVHGVLGGAATNVLSGVFNNAQFSKGNVYGFNTQNIVNSLVKGAVFDLAGYVGKKIGGQAGFSIQNIIQSSLGSVEGTLFAVPFQQLDQQFLAEFGNPDFDVRNAIAALSPQNYVFPSDLTQKFWIRFNFKKYNRDANVGAAYASDTIRLPIPSNLLDNYSIQYNVVSLGALGGTNANIVNDFVNDLGGQFGNDKEAAFRNLGSAINTQLLNSETAGVLARRAASGFSDAVGTTIDQVQGNILNPYATQAFQGVDFKQHEFSWKFSPRDPNESQALMFIIQKFKFHAAPQLSNNGMRMSYPSICTPELYTGTAGNKYLFPFKPCFITAVNVNYAPSGVPSFFKGTNAPTEVELRISLRENELELRNDIALHSFGTDIIAGPNG